MSETPEALRLADALDELDAQFSFPGMCGEAAAELRRLHTQRDALVRALNDILACTWMAGPSGTTVYVVSEDRMKAARAALVKATGDAA